MDNQARICHSTTVDGVANTWGYGAMTNSFNDMQNSKAMLFLGSNAAEAHPSPCSTSCAPRRTAPKMIVVDPRFTRTAAHADIYARIRSGTDIPFIYGLLWHIFKNGWEDKEFIARRVYAMDDIRKEAEKWPPEEVENVTGIPKEKVFEIAKTMAKNRPGTIVWCMGVTQHHMASHTVRLFCILQLALGNIGMSGGGANIFRGHDNVQGATDVGPNCHTLSCYYGLAEGSWKHWAGVWGVDYEWIKSRFDMSRQYDTGGGKMAYTMNMPGIPVSRWIDGVLEDKANLSQKDNLRAVIFQGHACNSQTRGTQMKKALEKLDLLVISDPFPTHMAVMSDRKNDTYLLPTCDPVRDLRLLHGLEPLPAVAREDHRAALRVPAGSRHPVQAGQEAGIRRRDVQEHQGRQGRAGHRGRPSGDQPRRLDDRLHRAEPGATQAPRQVPQDLRHHRRSRAESGPCKGDYYGLPWPCWGKPRDEAPGHPDPVRHRANRWRKAASSSGPNWGTEHEGKSLLASGVYLERIGDQGRLPRIHRRHPQEARLVERPDAGREEGGRGEELEDRPVRRHPARGRSSTGALPSETAGPAATSGPTPTQSPSTASRCTRRGSTW